MGRRPFYKRFGGDRIMATRDLSLEERAAYDDLLDLMYDRGRPIPDEPRFLSGLIGISLRKWGVIRDSLIAAGKIVVRGEYLSNTRFEREMELDEAQTQAAVTWGSKGGRTRAAREREARAALAREREPELGLNGAECDLSTLKTSRKRAENALKSETPFKITEQESQISATPDQAPLKHARASIFQSPERESYDSLGNDKAREPRKPKPKPKASRVKSKAARQMPKGWEPPPPTERIEALTAHWNEARLATEEAKFRNHAAQNGRTCKDWNAAWRNWLENAVEMEARRTPHDRTVGNWTAAR
jgi:uncharacterized protein YdaU (DUF1376 family)